MTRLLALLWPGLLGVGFLTTACQSPPPHRPEAEARDLLGRPVTWVSLAGGDVKPPSVQELPRTVLTSADGAADVTWRLDLPAHEIHRLGHLQLELDSDQPTTVRLGWIESPEASLRWSPFARAVDGHQTLECAPRWELPMAQNVTALTLQAPAAANVRLRAARLQITQDAGTGWVTLGGVSRRALVLRPGMAAQWSLKVPPSAHLEFSFGVAESAWERNGDGSCFQVDVARQGEAATILWQRTLNPRDDLSHRRWFATSLDLSSYAGEEIVLRLAARGSPPRQPPFTDFDDVRNDAPVFGAPRIAVSETSLPNVLIILVDTLRRDELGLFGGRAAVSPALDRLLSASVVFDHAYATGSWTHPSTASLLTGLLPPQHGLGTSPAGVSWFRPGVSLLAETFQAAGYTTAAVSNNLIVSPEEGFAAGMDCFDTRPFESSQVYGAERMTRFALEWLAEPRQAPFFLYLHYFDPHDRYQAPLPHTRAYVDARDVAQVDDARILAGQVNPLRTRLYRDGRRTDYDPPPAELSVLRGLYRGEIQYVDAWIGRLLDALEDRGLLENTIVVFTADHGEEFLDHGYLKHGQGLYDELIRVPLSIRFPDGTATGHHVDSPVSLVDIAPTLLGACGLPAGPLPGQDLHAGLRAGSVALRPVFSVSYGGQATSGIAAHGPKQAVVEGRWKLIHSLGDDRLELYDLLDDPLEQHDLSAEQPDLAARLRDLAAEALASDAKPSAAPLTPEMLEKLKALGYVD